MKVRFPLYLKILLWFGLNLILVGFCFLAFLHTQVPLGPGGILTAQIGPRMQAIGALIGNELRHSPPSQWSEILSRFGDAYEVRFLLLDMQGVQVGGEPIELPGEVRRQFLASGGLPVSRGGGRGMGFRRPPQESPMTVPEPTHWVVPHRLFLRTDNPTRYWAAIRMPGSTHGRQGDGPITLVAVSDSMAGGGLFLDYRPWLVVAAGVFLLSVLFWIPLVRGITRSLSQMTETTAHIAEGRFDVRTTIRRSDELGRLSAAINQMTGRLSDLVNGQRRFLGDIAHELCSPLARIQMALGVLEQRLADPQKSLLTDLSEEVEEMSVLVNELLAFTQASLGSKQVRLQRINLLELVQKAAQREAGARAAVLVDIPERLEVQADANLLGRAVANLIRNALRYAGNSSPPGIQAYPEKHEVILRIYDEGPGVPAIELNRLFEPFYRPDQARSRETGGIGLGLAIVKSCVEACHGSVTAMNRKPAGFEVRIRLKAWKP